MTEKELVTVDGVLSVLGGTSDVMALTGTEHSQTISNWRARGKFPANLHLVMTSALKERGYAAAPKLWQQISPPPERDDAALAGSSP